MSTMNIYRRFVGPRIPDEVGRADKSKFTLPSLLLGVSALLLLISIFFPYWQMTLLAPQYPGGLKAVVYVNRLEGDVREIDGLNHYIGMRPLEEAAQLERSVSIAAIGILALLVLGAIFIHTKWAVLLIFPAVVMPFVFLADMYFWMRNFGLNLDPRAPLSSAIKPFVPPILGSGFVGQFETVASFRAGLYMAFAASILIIVGLFYHRRAYKPLVDAGEQ